jgi:phage terminase large subunit
MTAVKAEFPKKLQFLFQPSRYKVLYGGRGGAKSWGVARALLIQAAATPLRVLCAREFQNSITESVHHLLQSQIAALGLESFYEVQNNKGANGLSSCLPGCAQPRDQIVRGRVWWKKPNGIETSWEVLIPRSGESSEIGCV